MSTAIPEDENVKKPRTTGITPVSGATDFSIDLGALKAMGDLRLQMVDYHSSRWAMYFRKARTKLSDGSYTLDLDDYCFVDPIYAPRFAATPTPIRAELGETMDIRAQRHDGIDRTLEKISLIWPDRFAIDEDLDVGYMYYKRRVVLADGTSIVLAITNGKVLPPSEVYYSLPLGMAYSNVAAGIVIAGIVQRHIDTPEPYIHSGLETLLGNAGTARASVGINPWMWHSGAPYNLVWATQHTDGGGSNYISAPTPITQGALTFPMPDLPASVTCERVFAPQDIDPLVSYTIPTEGEPWIVPLRLSEICFYPMINSDGASTLDDPFFDPNYIYRSGASVSGTTQPTRIVANGIERPLVSDGNGNYAVIFNEPFFGRIHAEFQHTITVWLRPSIGGEYARQLALGETEAAARAYAKRNGYPIEQTHQEITFSVGVECEVMHPDDPEPYIMAKVLTLGYIGLIDAPRFGTDTSDGGFIGMETIGVRTQFFNDGTYRLWYPNSGLFAYTMVNESAPGSPFTFEFDIAQLL